MNNNINNICCVNIWICLTAALRWASQRGIEPKLTDVSEHRKGPSNWHYRCLFLLPASCNPNSIKVRTMCKMSFKKIKVMIYKSNQFILFTTEYSNISNVESETVS